MSLSANGILRSAKYFLVVFTSSVAVYRRSFVQPVREDGRRHDPADDDARKAYGVGKVRCEDLLRRSFEDDGFPATTLRVTLNYRPGGVGIVITDDGAGPAHATEHVGFGLAGMRERVRIHGGTLAIAPKPGEGTVISAWIPLVPAVR